MAKQKIALTSERDLPILDFLWKWKLATTSAIAVKFFPDTNTVTAYNRLTLLKTAGVIELRCDEQLQNYYWALTKKGFLAIESRLPELKERGFKSEHVSHDALVTALHIGDLIYLPDQEIRLFSEQQLRRLGVDSFPSWVPKSDKHRSDGYWGVPKSDSIFPIALEVELNQKNKFKYEDVGDFYSDQAEVLRVLWVVPSQSMAHRIQSIIQKAVSDRYHIHNFVMLEQFQKLCWKAEITLGPEKGKTISGFLSSMCKGHALAVQTSCDGTGHPLLETKIKPLNPRACLSADFSKNPN